MKNKEKFAEQILEIACSGSSIAFDQKAGRVISCSGTNCSDCLFWDGCSRKRIKEWSESEYVEPVKISKRDRAFLEYIKACFKYIARDENGRLFVYSEKPIKKSCYYDNVGRVTVGIVFAFDIKLPMVKWEDSEPWLIEDLKKLKVCEEYEID